MYIHIKVPRLWRRSGVKDITGEPKCLRAMLPQLYIYIMYIIRCTTFKAKTFNCFYNVDSSLIITYWKFEIQFFVLYILIILFVSDDFLFSFCNSFILFIYFFFKETTILFHWQVISSWASISIVPSIFAAPSVGGNVMC